LFVIEVYLASIDRLPVNSSIVFSGRDKRETAVQQHQGAGEPYSAAPTANGKDVLLHDSAGVKAPRDGQLLRGGHQSLFATTKLRSANSDGD
jgi:hypothetical protein